MMKGLTGLQDSFVKLSCILITVFGFDIYLYWTFIVHNGLFTTWGYNYYYSTQVLLSFQ